MSERAKLGLLCFLLLLTLGIAILMVANAMQAVHTFQQQNNAIQAGDVSTIRPWMTIHAISHIYHVPETYLERSLNIARAGSLRHVTLYEIAARKHQPVEKIIHALQQTILTYRKKASRIYAPIRPPTCVMNPGVPAPEETKA